MIAYGANKIKPVFDAGGSCMKTSEERQPAADGDYNSENFEPE